MVFVFNCCCDFYDCLWMLAHPDCTPVSGIKTRYIWLPDLLVEYGDAVIMAGQQERLLTKYGNIPRLIIDEWLVIDISESELYFLFELIVYDRCKFPVFIVALP